jgi:two-component SAPR family response regulator
VNFTIKHEIDSELFRYALEAGKKSTNNEERFSHLEDAIQLYRGDFLVDVDYDWAVLERENLRRQYIDALIELAEYNLKIRKFEKTLHYANTLIKVEPYNETGYLLSMRAYSAMKNKSGVIRQYGKYQRFVQEHMDNEISQSTRDLFEELRQ